MNIIVIIAWIVIDKIEYLHTVSMPCPPGMTRQESASILRKKTFVTEVLWFIFHASISQFSKKKRFQIFNRVGRLEGEATRGGHWILDDNCELCYLNKQFCHWVSELNCLLCLYVSYIFSAPLFYQK